MIRALIVDRVHNCTHPELLLHNGTHSLTHTYTHTWRRRRGVQWRWWLVVPFRVAHGVMRCGRLCCRRPVRRRAGGRGAGGALEPEEAVERERERHVEQQQRADQHQLHARRRRRRRARAAARRGLHTNVRSSVACWLSLFIRSSVSIRS